MLIGFVADYVLLLLDFLRELVGLDFVFCYSLHGLVKLVALVFNGLVERLDLNLVSLSNFLKLLKIS